MVIASRFRSMRPQGCRKRSQSTIIRKVHPCSVLVSRWSVLVLHVLLGTLLTSPPWNQYASAFAPLSNNRNNAQTFHVQSAGIDFESRLLKDRKSRALKATIIESGSRVLNPKQILDPLYFPYSNSDETAQENDINGNSEKTQARQNTISEGIPSSPLPLYRAIDTMIQALNSISNVDLNSNDALVQLETSLHGSLFERNDLLIPSDNTQQFTIRIEQSISHSVDPLCWLHANAPPWKTFSASPATSTPTLYLSNVEATLEVAVYGAATTISDLSNDGDSWTLIKNLPEGSRCYGGGRFDYKTPIDNIGQDWKDFGKGMWILPGIELRREKEGDMSSNDAFMRSDDMSRYDDDKTKNHVSATTLAVHLIFSSPESLIDSARGIIRLLQEVTHDTSPPAPPTTLPPIVSRGYNKDAQEVFERGIGTLLDIFESNEENQSNHKTGYEPLQKVVMARRSDLYYAGDLSGLDVMLKLKFGGDVGGHLFYLNPGMGVGKEFFGCTPERLFSVQSKTGLVKSEALAGTRPRGSTSKEDEELLRDLMCSEKDRAENEITREFIINAFNRLRDKGLLVETKRGEKEGEGGGGGQYLVRRLRHLQHLCQNLEERIGDPKQIVEITKVLLDSLHPTPAVGGSPLIDAMDFIRQYESKSFDRGLYAGPFGYLAKDSADILVAIRSALLTTNSGFQTTYQDDISSKLSIYAGAGIVPGSTVQGEWLETGSKLGVLTSLFSQAPLTLKSYGTANEAWAIAFIDELIRSGITQYYVCPGSRSTPLTAALARAMRAYVGIIDVISIHDERSSGFRALGHARGTKRPAAVVTSSGTAVANLYPSIIESSMDGLPLLVLTADRPYENRDIGANQAIDQLKIFSDSYIRWFRDISPPSDDVAVSLALSDANHAVSMTKTMKGPVHLNIQFRENLAPESGPIRGDNRVGSTNSFSTARFTDVAGFTRWSLQGSKWIESYAPSSAQSNNWKNIHLERLTYDIASLIARSKRGIIIVGSVKSDLDELTLSSLISDFAQIIGFPIFAGAQSAGLRFESSAVIAHAEHILKNPTLKSNIKPDLIIQIGSTLVSSELEGLVSNCLKEDMSSSHVLIHPHRAAERADPWCSVTHKVDLDVSIVLPNVQRHFEKMHIDYDSIGSTLATLTLLGRQAQKLLPKIIHDVSNNVIKNEEKVWNRSLPTNVSTLTEPQILLAMSEVFSNSSDIIPDLFLSNSMPVRDAEFFMYPSYDHGPAFSEKSSDYFRVSMNRGASGIDGIISSAIGFTEANLKRTTLLIGDLATLHDLNAFHNLNPPKNSRGALPLTTVIVNNDGGGIFSFLPIAKHGSDVGFEEFFGTPTNSFSFRKGADAFGIPYQRASSYQEFKLKYASMINENHPQIMEAEVVSREKNVQVHTEITRLVGQDLNTFIKSGEEENNLLLSDLKLSTKVFRKDELRIDVDINPQIRNSDTKTLVLLHGWMGDKNDWDKIAMGLIQDLPDDWIVISIDLPGHGKSTNLFSRNIQVLRASLGFDQIPSDKLDSSSLSIEAAAISVLNTLSIDLGISRIDALCGYSLGGRIALSMKRLCSSQSVIKDGESKKAPNLVLKDTQLILFGADPGNIDNSTDQEALTTDRLQRVATDKALAEKINRVSRKTFLKPHNSPCQSTAWIPFMSKWYRNEDLWGNLEIRNPQIYRDMVSKRITAMNERSFDLAYVLRTCSPGRNSHDDWKYVHAKETVFVAGEYDKKYSRIGRDWVTISPGLRYKEIKDAGHALLSEAPDQISDLIKKTVTENSDDFRDEVLDREEYNSEIMKIEAQKSSRRTTIQLGSFDFDAFRIELKENNQRVKGVNGIGWGEQGRASNKVKERKGFLINISSKDHGLVGIGEISPLAGVHPETYEDVYDQIHILKDTLASSESHPPELICEDVLSLNGSLTIYIESALKSMQLEMTLLSSVKSGIEMALLSLAAQAVRYPLPIAILKNSSLRKEIKDQNKFMLPLNGLLTRGVAAIMTQREEDFEDGITYSSMKVKVSHRSPVSDAEEVIKAQFFRNGKNKVRADANRGWDLKSALEFASKLVENDKTVLNNIEFIEEPLKKQLSGEGKFDFSRQIKMLEIFYDKTGIRYALDESIADISLSLSTEDIIQTLRSSLQDTSGCAALILKPAVLGMELSLRLARFSRDEMGIGAVFTSTFDSGIGLAFISFLATISDIEGQEKSRQYAHGLSTFSMLSGDTLSPAFKSYVTDDGTLKVAPLGRAIYGLGLEEIRDTFYTMGELKAIESSPNLSKYDYQTTSTTDDTGREIQIQVTLPLPFPADIACTRFTDLPQQPRWSPWLKSVDYLDSVGETEWTLNVRGVEFRWKAMSTLLDNPKGILWESSSGLKNKGTTGELVRDFVEEKLLKWSLESFRDVVKADLALERGDAELGDALIDAVEGRANAIEATLSFQGFEDPKR